MASLLLLVTMTARRGSREDEASLTADAEALNAALSELVRLYQFRDRNRICCYDISVTQCYALEALVQHGPLRLGTLAEKMHLDKSTTSRVIQTLVRKGYAANAPERGDRRAVTVVATAAGRRLHQRITADLVEEQRLMVEGLDPAIRAGVIEVIRRLAKSAEERFVCGVSVGEPSERAAACCEGVAAKE
jgi:MarR family transcriptional regulator, 2-MHQ and catechol-resistance regulon repressor